MPIPPLEHLFKQMLEVNKSVTAYRKKVRWGRAGRGGPVCLLLLRGGTDLWSPRGLDCGVRRSVPAPLRSLGGVPLPCMDRPGLAWGAAA